MLTESWVVLRTVSPTDTLTPQGREYTPDEVFSLLNQTTPHCRTVGIRNAAGEACSLVRAFLGLA